MSERGPKARHPWHPALVHFPIACWMLGAAINLISRLVDLPELPGIEPNSLSHVLHWAGNVFALPTIAAGLVDDARLPSAIQDGSTIKRHIMWMGSAWTLVLVVELAGAACLVIGGWAAAKVVFVEMAARPGRR